MFAWDAYGNQVGQNVTCGGTKMVRKECTWDVCVHISYTGDEGQLIHLLLLLHGSTVLVGPWPPS